MIAPRLGACFLVRLGLAFPRCCNVVEEGSSGTVSSETVQPISSPPPRDPFKCRLLDCKSELFKAVVGVLDDAVPPDEGDWNLDDPQTQSGVNNLLESASFCGCCCSPLECVDLLGVDCCAISDFGLNFLFMETLLLVWGVFMGELCSDL